MVFVRDLIGIDLGACYSPMTSTKGSSASDGSRQQSCVSRTIVSNRGLYEYDLEMAPQGAGFICPVRTYYGVAPFNVLVHSESVNAIIGWVLTGVVALAIVESVFTDAPLWGGFASLIVAVTVLPPWLSGDWTVMVPWPLLLVATAAVLVRAFDIYLEIAGYFAVATLALIAVIELDAFTPVEMSRRFAVAFAALSTLAIQGLWTIAQYASDLWFGTEFLRSQRELQLDIVIVTIIGIAMGAAFNWYFDRVEHAGSSKHPRISSR